MSKVYEINRSKIDDFKFVAIYGNPRKILGSNFKVALKRILKKKRIKEAKIYTKPSIPSQADCVHNYKSGYSKGK